MKKSLLVGLIIVTISMVSYATAIPYTESQPLVEKINKVEHIRNIFDSIPFIGDLIGLISVLIGSLILIPTYIFLIFGLAFLSSPMPMKIGGAVFTLIGIAIGLISSFFISFGVTFSPELGNPFTLLIAYLLPVIISILIVYSILY